MYLKSPKKLFFTFCFLVVLLFYVLIFIYNWTYWGEKSLNSLKYDEVKKKKDIRLLKVTKWLSGIFLFFIMLIIIFRIFTYILIGPA